MDILNGSFDCRENDGAKNKKELNDLIQRAGNGSREAFEELRSRYNPLIESRISVHVLPEMTQQDIEDLREEALILFCNAVCNYDHGYEGVEFGLYAKICIENGLISFIRSYVRRKKKNIFFLSPELQGNDSLLNDDDPMQDMIDSENLASLVKLIQSNLSEYESRVWWLYVSGMAVADIAQLLGGVEPKSVSNAIYRIRKKLRTCLSDK